MLFKSVVMRLLIFPTRLLLFFSAAAASSFFFLSSSLAGAGATAVEPVAAVAVRECTVAVSVSASSASASPVVPLSNVEAMWDRLSADEQLVIHQQLEEIQKKDWKTLSIDEKKAGTSLVFVYRASELAS